MFEWRSRWGFPLAFSSSSAWQCNSDSWRLGAAFFLIVLMIGWDFMTFLYVSIHHYIKHVITITVMYNAYPCMHVDILCCIFISQSVTEPTCKTYECRFPPLFDVGVFFEPWSRKAIARSQEQFQDLIPPIWGPFQESPHRIPVDYDKLHRPQTIHLQCRICLQQKGEAHMILSNVGRD